MKELELCPFCGMDMIKDGHTKSCYISIFAKGLSTNEVYSDDALESAWNTRASVSHADLQKVVDEYSVQRKIMFKDADSLDEYEKGEFTTLTRTINKLEALLKPPTT